MSEQNSRRNFIKQASVAGALTAASYSRVLGANDRIQMGDHRRRRTRAQRDGKLQ